MADTTFLKDNLTGAVPTEIASDVIKNIINQASILKVAKRVPMASDTKTLPKLTNSGSASWVGEGERIGTTIPEFDYPQLKAKKLAVIIPVTREKVNDTTINVFGELQSAMADAFATAIDNACIWGINTPFATSLYTSMPTGNKIAYATPITTAMSTIMGFVEENGYNCSNVLMGLSSKKEIRDIVNDAKYKDAISMGSIYNTPLEYVRDWDNTKGIAITGDFSKAIIGTREGMEYEILREATIESNGKTIYLAQDDMVAIKATIRIGFLVAEPKAFSLLEP